MFSVARRWPRAIATLAAATSAISCGPTVHTATPPKPTRANTFRPITPLQFRAEAKAADQALLLGTEHRGGATAVPLAGGPSAVTVDVPVVPAQPTPTTAVLTTTPSSDGQLRIGVLDETSLDPSWPSGVWMAALIATGVLDKDVADFSFTADARGPIDGTPGSALMTTGFLASILGVAIDPGATILGIINPDGTIGPVGGIPQQLDAAIAAGKKRIGYPIGMGQATDRVSDQPVDLEARATSQGATAVEVADIYGALELLTGTKLPRPLPVDEADLALAAPVVTELGLRYDGWHQRLAVEWTQVLELRSSGRVPAPLAELAAQAERETDRADRLHQRGSAVAAYHHVVRAWTDAASATAVRAVLERVRQGDLAAARAKLDGLAGMADTVDDSLRAIGAVVPDSMASHLRMMSAFEEALGGWGFRAFTEDQLAAARATLDGLAGADPARLASRATADLVAATVAPAVRSIARAVAAATTATETLAIEREPSISYLCSLPEVRRNAASFRAAASANLAYFEARFVAELARTLALPLDAAKVRVATHEPDYLIAIMTSGVDELPGLPAELKQTWGEDSITWGLFRLAASEASFFRTSLLVSRFHSLEVEVEPATGQPTAVGQPEAFANLLTWAERRAREHARAARVATGSIPVQTRLRYQLARSLADGDLADQLAALENYWAASLFSQTAVMLARNPR